MNNYNSAIEELEILRTFIDNQIEDLKIREEMESEKLE